MSDVVQRAKKALEGVTDGPWVHGKERNLPRNEGGIYPGNVVSDTTGQIVFTQTGNGRNSSFIAASRELVPELVVEAERLRKQVDLVRTLHVVNTINCVTCPIDCEEHEDGCPDDRPVNICSHCWEHFDPDVEFIDQAVLWPCETAKLVYSTDELEAGSEQATSGATNATAW